MKSDFKKLQSFTRRAFIITLFQFIFFFLIFIRYFYLQIIDVLKYKTLSDKNRVRLFIIPSPRGIVVDRNNSEIIANRLSYTLIFEPTEHFEIALLLNHLKKILPERFSVDDERLKHRMRRTKPGGILTIAEDLKWEEVAKIELYTPITRNIRVHTSHKRVYSLSKMCAHVTGYIGHVSKSELSALNIPNTSDLYTGKNGVEKFYNEELQGTPGIKRTEVDAFGRYVRDLSYTEAIQGNTLQLTIDQGLQQEVSSLLDGKTGAAVVLDIDTGQVLAMHSEPSFDPNLFVAGMSQKSWRTIKEDPRLPMINRSISAEYPPGSTFKIVSALAGLEYGVSEHFRVVCTGTYQVGNRTFHCTRKHGHGLVNMKLAIAQSCNTYFYNIAEKMGIKNIVDTAHVLGLGSKTNIELPYERSGHIPDTSWKLSTLKKKWMSGDTINAAIGQGFVLVTIIQLAQMVGRIASGKLITPTLISQNNGANSIRAQGAETMLKCQKHHLDLIRGGMYMAYNDYRGNMYPHRLQIPGLAISGKTGTAQVISSRKVTNRNLQDHGLFVGFAPFSSPKYAVAVIVEHGSWGALSALPIANPIFVWLHANS
ncbi:penicillin-binding protein 2 [Rickettsiales endosymbiont of Peranema trichophorum]|uniref:penicillin-binding protein 2 n=1 Tax=Rickettsiales endosymbiont of Peranema trichophorum TaxID=2486577 RepID=UPI0010233002|nr:penicillin-binding protein 2 [Rickettsiales endosymbiont of Peranema trichophorum]RZI47356.1 penicillin-binding protein 2 [Rickettsiales endosymbiont of Peranema trichophorum]